MTVVDPLSFKDGTGMRYSLLTIAVLGLAPIGSATAQTPDTAQAQVLAAIDSFLVGLRTQDAARMALYTDTLTRFTLLRPGPSGTRVMLLSASQFMTAVTRPGQPALDEPIRNPIVQIDGDLASVWAEYQVRIDGKVSHCGFDAFHLARLGGKWKILNVSDTFRRTGCGDPWR